MDKGKRGGCPGPTRGVHPPATPMRMTLTVTVDRAVPPAASDDFSPCSPYTLTPSVTSLSSEPVHSAASLSLPPVSHAPAENLP